MKYENAKDVLPKELFEEVQKYASGKLLYFPIAGPRSLWGTKNGNRVFCTHIHDNHGRDPKDYWGDQDEHLMPFDGNIDYADMMKRLLGTPYSGALTLETGQSGKYLDISQEEYLKIAFDRIRKIAEQ